MASPKTLGSYTPTAAGSLTGSEVVPYAIAGSPGTNGTAQLNALPVSTTQQTAINKKLGKTSYTVGKVGSGADYECTGTNDHIPINAAITAAATSGNITSIEILGYRDNFKYSIGAPIVLQPVTGGMVNIYGRNAELTAQTGYSGDIIITKNFYSEINTNYNSYSTIGAGKISGLKITGNSGGGTVHTITYANLAAFPSTGDTTKMYIARDTDTGYLWNGTAYTTSGIARSGLHWRAYAYHLIKLYAFNYILEDIELEDALEFALYSEQTNTDTTTFNNYATMESTIRRLRIVGYNLGGINWFGPHDSNWQDVKVHTNQYSSTTALYNIYVESTPNSNGGGLEWYDIHPWGNTATYGSNVIAKNTSIKGSAYIEGSQNIGLNATGSTIQLNMVTTNNSFAGIQLTNCYNCVLDIINYYQFNSVSTLVKLVGTLSGSQIYVRNVDINNLSGTPAVFDVSALTTATNNMLFARIPNSTPSISAGITTTTTVWDSSNELDIIKVGATLTALTVIKRTKSSASAIPAVNTANITLSANAPEQVIDATAASRTATLPDATTYSGPALFIKRLDATFTSGNSVTIATASSQTIDGGTTYVLSTQGAGVRLTTNGTNWIITGKV